MKRSGEDGYALVAAVVSVAAFALMSLAMVNGAGASLAGLSAESERARLAAAAEAGTAIAIRNLLVEDRARRWPIDGGEHHMRFDGMALTIIIEDERGKIPLNLIEEDQARAMFAAAGAEGDRLDELTDSFLDWRDDDEETRPHGAEAPWYEARGLYPRNGALRTIDEMALIRGIDRRMLERLRPAVTVVAGSRGGFDPRFSHPFALAVLNGGGGAVATIQRGRELAGQRAAIDIADDVPLTGRPLSVRVKAEGAGGSAYGSSTIVELTGAESLPYVVRQFE